MRLIDTSTFEIKTFLGDNVPPYAILSHTWDQEELTYHEMIDGNFEQKQGYHKIELCCKQAREDGFKYAWIDTCCIDKTSSAELSEAINSMFRWYKESSICYVFLSDADGTLVCKDDPKTCARWFTRSWTLQELLAPETVIFYDQNWGELGTTNSLARSLAVITGIPVTLFLFGMDVHQHSIADRLSWAADRQATRIEDRAYSLLGLFSINMPLLYGEGNQAFARLQRKIVKSSSDLSIFAWTRPATGPNIDAPEVSWLLAESLDDFRCLYSIKQEWYHKRPEAETRTGLGAPMRLTSYSVELDLPICMDDANSHRALAYLGCKLADKGKNEHLCVRLFKQEDRWLRHQELKILKVDAADLTKNFRLTRLQFDLDRWNVFTGDTEHSGSMGLLPFQMRMPTIYLSVTGNFDVQARLRYIVDTESGPSKQSIDRPTPELTYAIVTTDGPNWQKFTNVSVADLDFTTSVGTGSAPIVLQPHLKNMRFYMHVVSTIMVLEILEGEKAVVVELVVGMKMTDYGPQVYTRVSPIEARGKIERLWNLHPPPDDMMDAMEFTADHEDMPSSYRILAKIRPTGCVVHNSAADQCECRSRQVSIHLEREGKENSKDAEEAPETSRGTRQTRGKTSNRKRKATPTAIKDSSASKRKSTRAQSQAQMQAQIQTKLRFTPIWLANCNEPGFPKPGDPTWSVAMGV